MKLSKDQKEAVKDFCEEMSNSMFRVEGEKTFQKEAVKNLSEEHEIAKPLLRKLARTYHQSNFQETQSENETFETVYSDIFGDSDDDDGV